uniref:Uncharacterized protein n=1 Tax=Kuetzingia canaliculata TaxID=228262 RepID=A0A1Z1MPM6_KUECA|nr:hypothetical protein [Kuetzingia canaliculata]ARW67886.1 hypothetical protein [Kuetzingia canaliculata]
MLIENKIATSLLSHKLYNKRLTNNYMLYNLNYIN